MKDLQEGLWIFMSLWFCGSALVAQESENTALMSPSTYDKSSQSVVRVVADEGERMGAGVIIGIDKDGNGLILTSYSMVTGTNKVAVIFKDDPRPLLGHVIQKWIDYDSELAVVVVKNLPQERFPIEFKTTRSGILGSKYFVIGHTLSKDWDAIETTVSDENEQHLVCNIGSYSGIEGAPLVDHDGRMIGLIVSYPVEESSDDHLTLAVKTNHIKEVVDEWFEPLGLKKKWRQKGGGFVTWLWAVGGGVAGATVAAVVALSSNGGSRRGLPRPPSPPEKP